MIATGAARFGRRTPVLPGCRAVFLPTGSTQQEVPLNPTWLPNWRDRKAYPFSDRTPLPVWAWEFLRRNPQYQIDWERAVGPVCTESGAIARITPEIRELRQRYRILFPLAPSVGNASPLFDVDLVRIARGSVASLPKNDIALIFDRSLPLERQLKNAKRELESQGFIDNETRNHRDKWPSYLRVLDGIASGETISTIASILFPRLGSDEATQTIKNHKRQAENLRDGGYKGLVNGAG